MTRFRNYVQTHERLDIARKHETALNSSGQNPQREPGFSRIAYRKDALRNHLRSRLRQKLGHFKENSPK